MKIIFAIAIFLSAVKAMACECATRDDFKDTIALKRYDFIARVKVVKVAPTRTDYPYVGFRKNGDIQIEVKELFKGQSASAAFDPNFESDCALYTQVGEEWLFFGRTYKGRLNVSYCSYSARYRNKEGVREWLRFDGIRQLALLRQLYGHPVNSNNIARVLYPDGNLEIEQTFKNNLLNGVRKIYYPDGKLYVTEQFANGRRVGYRDVYTADGQLQSHVTYSEDFIKKNILYHDTIYSAKEFNYLFQHPETSYWGKKRYAPKNTLVAIDSVQILKTKSLPYFIYHYEPGGRSCTYQYYYLDGKLKSETMVDWDKKRVEEHEYNTDGKLTSHKILDQKNDSATYFSKYEKDPRKGKCGECQYYFKTDNPPEGTPETVYIQ